VNGRIPASISPNDRKNILLIKSLGLRLVVLDASSLPFAAKNNSVGLVRDRLARFIINRFTQANIPNGIILSTDADCELDPLCISQAITSFNKHSEVVAAVGRPQGYYPSTTPMSEEIAAYFEFRKEFQSFLTKLNILNTIPVPKLFSKFKLEGFCACFRVDAYLKAGGFAHIQGGEDYVLGFRLAQLGKVLEIPSIVKVPLRISRRTSMGEGLGWEVERALQAVQQSHLLVGSLEYYQAHGKIIQSLIKGLPYSEFIEQLPHLKQSVNIRLYNQLLKSFKTKSEFLLAPQDYFALKQLLLKKIQPKLRTKYPDVPIDLFLKNLFDQGFISKQQGSLSKKATQTKLEEIQFWTSKLKNVLPYNQTRLLHS
jgi:hypothetical protein